MQIRLARAEETEALHALVLRAYAAYPEQIGVRPAPMDDDYAARVAAGQAFVAFEGEELVGAVVLIAGEEHLQIDNVAVEPSWQNRGVGGELLQFAQTHAMALGLSELRLYTNVAMARNRVIYAHLGYHETELEEGPRFTRVHFSKRI